MRLSNLITPTDGATISGEDRQIDGLSAEMIRTLAEQGVVTRDDLADLAVDDLTDMIGIDAEAARAIIMKAREHWFNQ